MGFNAIKEAFGDIADAIRAKAGTTGTMKASEMPAAIAAIPSGGLTWEDAFEVEANVDAGWITAGYWSTVQLWKKTFEPGKLYKATVLEPNTIANGIAIGMASQNNSVTVSDGQLSLGFSLNPTDHLDGGCLLTCNRNSKTLYFMAPENPDGYEYKYTLSLAPSLVDMPTTQETVTVKFEKASL